MNIDRMALYLSGKFSPFYQAPFDKLHLIELIRDQFYKEFPDDLFKLVDSESFYSICLNKVNRVDPKKLIELIKLLNIPSEAWWLEIKELRSDKLKELKDEFEKLKAMPDTKAKERGKLFEKWFIRLLELFELQPRHDIKNWVDQIDGSFVLDWQVFVFEIEWIDWNSDKNYIVEIADKASNLHWTLWLAIAYNGFTSTSFEKIKTKKNVLMMTWKNIESVLNEEIWFDELIRNIKRKGAEEWKPYLD